jgi:uncharacterized protein (DUF58 family)
MTTARTSQLIIRETEIEDQRQITLVLSTVAPADRDELFERSVSFVASLLWQLSERHYPLRLVVGAEDCGFDVGPDHLLVMMRALALCSRHQPTSPEAQVVRDYLTAMQHDDLGYVVAVTPWLDKDRRHHIPAANRVVSGPQLEELTHAF